MITLFRIASALIVGTLVASQAQALWHMIDVALVVLH